MAEKQTAGRDHLGDLAPKFAELNDDVLFGEVWAREEQLSPRDRSLITIAALFSAGLYPQLKSHLEIGKAHGVTKQEAVELVTQLAFYCGWPKAWSTFPLIREAYGSEEGIPGRLSVFPLGKRTMPLPSISPAKATWRRCPPSRCRCSTSHLNRAAGTTGTSTMLPTAADKC